jgi:DNA-binding NarL/FixJ family response regulator
MKARVILADDHTIVREGLRALLESCPGIEILAEAKNGQEAVAAARQLAADLVLMDVSMPVMNGIEATRQITTANPSVRVVALTMNADKQIVESMLHAGAVGFLLKDCSLEELKQTIEDAMAGRPHLAKAITEKLVKSFVDSARQEHPAAKAGLTPAECEVLRKIADGRSNKEMAAALKISIKTVEAHRANIAAKLDLHSAAELTKFAISVGLTNL